MKQKPGTHLSVPARFNNLYFWIYCMVAIGGMYLNLSFRRRGLSGVEIGAIGAVISITSVVITPLLGIRFDSAANRPAFMSVLFLLAGVRTAPGTIKEAAVPVRPGGVAAERESCR